MTEKKEKKLTKAQTAKKEADAIMAMSDPFAVLTHVAKECGMPASTLNGMIKRMRTQYQPVNEEIKRHTTKELVGKLDEKIAMALEYMDPYTFSQANLRDLNIALGILIEKRQLLSHEPTQIISVEERKHLGEIMPVLYRVLQTRGITIDATPEEPVRALPREDFDTKDVDATERRMRKHDDEQDMVLD